MVRIDVQQKKADIYLHCCNDNSAKSNSAAYTNHLYRSYDFEDLHVGADASNFKESVGNSIVLGLTGGRYVFIGAEIYEFMLEKGDSLLKYYSLVGKSDVPYPVLKGTHNVYFMLDKKYVSLPHLPSGMSEKQWENSYVDFYRLKKSEKNEKKMNNRHIHQMQITNEVISMRARRKLEKELRDNDCR